jgi:tetratricopeptide (TPR) repeat protein
MTPRTTTIALLLALVAGCATTSPGNVTGQRYKQAAAKLPQVTSFAEDAERGRMQNVYTHLQSGRLARQSGNTDLARVELGTAAEALREFADKFPSIEWRITFRYAAAELLAQSQRPAEAAEQAEKILVDPEATAESKAMAASLAAASWLGVASAKSRSGELEAITLAETMEQRKGQPLQPRVPVGEWKRFVDAADAYARVWEADPDKGKPGPQHRSGIGESMLAVRAAQVEFHFDNLQDARARLERIIEQWPGDTEAMEGAVPLYIATFRLLGDTAGAAQAMERVKASVAAAARKAATPAAAADYEKVQTMLSRFGEEAAFTNASQLLEAGKNLEAAAAYQAIAEGNPQGPNASNALYNASVALDKGGQAEKATALRARLLERYPEAKVAETALPVQAAALGRLGKAAEAVALYDAYLASYPEGGQRCAVLYNRAVSLETAKRVADAAQGWLTYGTEASCAREDPNSAAKMLHRAGQLFKTAKQKARAKEAFQACAAVKGVTDVVARSNQADAAKQARAR